MSETLILGRILFVGAHCDDIEIGCGGTAAKYAASGHPIAFAVATFDNDAKVAEVRKAEAIKAAKLIGVSIETENLFFGGFTEELSKRQAEVRKWLKEVSAKFKPDTVFMHRSDGHTDHQLIYNVGAGVFQNMNVFLYYIPRPGRDTPFDPIYAVDISNFIKTKISMCACHDSQPKDYIGRGPVENNGRFWYDRWFHRKAKKKDGYAEPFIIYASRSPADEARPKSQAKPLQYDLRLVREKDGSLHWRDG